MEWMDRIQIYFVDGSGSSSPNHWFFHYQTLVTGLIALFAAGLTVHFIRLQIRLSERQHREQIERQHRATRANLPFALVQLDQYSNDCLERLSKIMQDYGDDDDIEAEVECPELPREAMETITQLITFTSDGTARKLQAVLIFLQIQYSRLSSDFDRMSPSKNPESVVIKSNLRHDVLDACIILKMANYFYDYARFEVDELPSFADSGLTGALEYMLGRKFDERTIEYVTEKLVRFTEMALDERNAR